MRRYTFCKNILQIILVFSTLFTYQLNLFGQNIPPVIQWQKCFGGGGLDDGSQIKATVDGGYIIIGSTHSYDGDVLGIHGTTYDDCWVIKISSMGQLQWQKCLGGAGEEAGYSIEQTTDGGYILAAVTEYSYNDGDVYGNNGDLDAWIVKLDNSGNIEWAKCIGGGYGDDIESIHQTSDGGYILGGATISPEIGGRPSGLHGSESDAWVVKMDSIGDIEWYKCYGGTNAEDIHWIEQTDDGGYIFTRKASSTDGDVVGFHGGTLDFWVVKIDSTGNLMWQKCLGGSGEEQAYSIHQTFDGGFITCGYTYGSNDGDVTGNHGQSDLLLIKLSRLGDVLWQKCLGGSNFESYAISTGQDANGNYIIAGTTQSNNGQVSGNKGISNFWMVKVNNSGTLLWQQCFGGSKVDEPTSVLSTPDGGSIVIGNASSNDGDISGNHGGGDIWVLKLSPGFLLPLRLLSFNCYRENNFVITQWQTANEDHVKNFVVERSYAGLTFDSIGSLPAKGNLQSINNYQFTDVSPFATNGNVIYYRLKTTDIDGRYSLSNIVAVRLENHSIISVNPNPAHNVLSINIESGKQEKIELYICDVEGQILQRKPLDLFKGNNFINLDVSSLSRGSYFLMFNTDSHNSYKWIKE